MMKALHSALCVALVLSVRAQAQGENAEADRPKHRHYPHLTSLAYVTPWNSRGNELVERYRHKLDMVSPVWYTVHVTDEQNNRPYAVRGGPPKKEDEEWYRRLQQPEKASDGTQSRIKIVPRFMLDGWVEDDYRALLFNETRWALLAEAIIGLVDKGAYDGLVFESALTHVLTAPLATLAAALHARDKDQPNILCLVLPPVRTPGAFGGDETVVGQFDRQNQAILAAVETLAEVADYLSIMTYDMTGNGGRESKAGREHGYVGDHTLREPGENTNKDWVRENMLAFAKTSGAWALPSVDEDDDLAALAYHVDELQHLKTKPRIITQKLLMGYPMYGYQFPILYMDQKTGKLSAAPTQGPCTAVIRGAGEAIMASHAVALKPASGAARTSEMPGSGEQCFEYEREAHDGWWLACHPTNKGIDEALKTISDVVETNGRGLGGSGIALWELGQAVPDLLDRL
ncbi:hypothetical protein P8C59_003768 [Phyllachora maydis]|uniref:Chitinase n=1 Tax=Phyllachora maydis TaxID=1825666 RepID=A0AAD9M9M7_9PEZI|nr:hypothetical protein P8C59_003768 [Phyllachora maydis]